MNPFLLKLSFIIAVAAHGADLASTENCLGAGRCKELNSLLARYNDPIIFGAAKMGVAGASEVLIYDMSKNHPKLAFLTNLGVGVAFTAIAVHNAKVAR